MPRAARSKKPAARASRAPHPMASTHGERPEDSAESESDSDLVDEALLSFVLTPAFGADHLLVLALSPAGDSVIQDRQASEAKRIPTELAISISVACERYAATERRAVRFKAAWLRGEKTLATYAWECGTSVAGERELDGSVQSFLIEQQLQQQAQHKLHLEGFEMVQESWKSLLTLQNKRIESLERDNMELRDRLRKMDDVGSELAIEQMRADLEQRGRTADMIQNKLLPIAQTIAMKHLNSSAAIAGNSDPEKSEQEKPAAKA